MLSIGVNEISSIKVHAEESNHSRRHPCHVVDASESKGVIDPVSANAVHQNHDARASAYLPGAQPGPL